MNTDLIEELKLSQFLALVKLLYASLLYLEGSDGKYKEEGKNRNFIAESSSSALLTPFYELLPSLESTVEDMSDESLDNLSRLGKDLKKFNTEYEASSNYNKGVFSLLSNFSLYFRTGKAEYFDTLSKYAQKTSSFPDWLRSGFSAEVVPEKKKESVPKDDSVSSLTSADYFYLTQFLYAGMLYVQGIDGPFIKEISYSDKLKPFYSLLPSLKSTAAGMVKESIENLVSIGKDLKQLVSTLSADTATNPILIKVLEDFSLYFLTGSPTSYKGLRDFSKKSKKLPTWIANGFSKEETTLSHAERQQPVIASLESLFKEITGRPGLFFEDADEIKAASKNKPETFKEYKRQLSTLSSIWKSALKDYVLSSGKSNVDWEDFESHLEQEGMIHDAPEGFKGKVDSNGNWLSPDGEDLHTARPSKLLAPKVEMNSNRTADNPWVFVTRNLKGERANYSYTYKNFMVQQRKKYKIVEDLVNHIDSMEAKWRKRIKDHSNPNHEFDASDELNVCAVVLDLVYRFSARPGTEGNATAGESTYGIFTLRRKHIQINVSSTGNSSIKIDYPGKDGIKTTHHLTGTDSNARATIDALKVLCEGKKPNTPVFTTVHVDEDTGERKFGRIDYRIPNKYLRSLYPPAFADASKKDKASVKSLRTLKATTVWKQNMDTLFAGKDTITLQEADQFRNYVAKIAGEHLNHVVRNEGVEQMITPDTAKAYYIDDAAQAMLYQHYNLPMPSDLKKKGHVSTSPDEGEETVTSSMQDHEDDSDLSPEEKNLQEAEELLYGPSEPTDLHKLYLELDSPPIHVTSTLIESADSEESDPVEDSKDSSEDSEQPSEETPPSRVKPSLPANPPATTDSLSPELSGPPADSTTNTPKNGKQPHPELDRGIKSVDEASENLQKFVGDDPKADSKDENISGDLNPALLEDVLRGDTSEFH